MFLEAKYHNDSIGILIKETVTKMASKFISIINAVMMPSKHCCIVSRAGPIQSRYSVKLTRKRRLEI